jgi:predicted transcriptional regulator of viral defense system
MNVAKVVRERINHYQVTEPILLDEILKDLDNYKNNVYVALNRLAKEGLILNYAKGIYYKPKESRFGQIGIDKRKLIEKKYIKRNDMILGYITGHQIWNEWGITTQIPKRIWIAQNIKQKKTDTVLNIMLIKAKGEIKEKNIKALQFLDIIDQIENIQNTSREDVIKKLITIYKENLGVYDRIAALEEVKKYTKKVKVLFGLIAESAGIKDEYFDALLEYMKEDIRKGKKIIVDIKPYVFNNNRTWGNGYALTQKPTDSVLRCKTKKSHIK